MEADTASEFLLTGAAEQTVDLFRHRQVTAPAQATTASAAIELIEVRQVSYLAFTKARFCT